MPENNQIKINNPMVSDMAVDTNNIATNVINWDATFGGRLSDDIVAKLQAAAESNNSRHNLSANSLDHSLLQLIDSTEWAILPEKLEQIRFVVMQQLAGNNINIRPEATKSYITNGVAVVPLQGTVLKRTYGLQAMSGVRSLANVRNDIQEALNNPEVSGIVLSIDSPGGTVDGTKEFADYIQKQKAIKPIIGYVDGMAASAAYWIAAACTSIVCFDTSKTGSIGVVVKHSEYSEYAKKLGIKETYIYRGEYKVIGNPSEPLSDTAKDHIQKSVDTYYEMFVDSVCEARKLDRECVLKDVATGATFVAKEALALNLIDSIGTLEDAITLAKEQGDIKMAEKETAASMEDLQAQLAQMQSTVTALQTKNEELAEALTAKEEAEAHQKRLEEVGAMFEGCELADATLEAFADLDDATLSMVCTEIVDRQKQIDATIENLGEVTPDASTDHNKTNAVSTIDAAVEHIMERDNVDVDEATDKAQVEYPDLFKAV